MKITFELSEEEFWSKLRVIVREELEDLYNTKEPERTEAVRKSTMIVTEPEVVDSGKYPIMHVCRILDMDIKTVLKYTKKGEDGKPPKLIYGINKLNGRKYFTGKAIKKFWESQY